MAFIPIENLGGGVAQAKKIYIFKSGVGYTSDVTLSVVTTNYGTITQNGNTSLLCKNTTIGDSWGFFTFSKTFAQMGIDYGYKLGLRLKTSADLNGDGRYITFVARTIPYDVNTSNGQWTTDYLISANTETEIVHYIDFATTLNSTLEFGVRNPGVLTTLEVFDIWLEPYPTRLANGELYSYGLGINDWDNSGYRNATSYTCDGGLTLNSKYMTCPTISSTLHNRSIVTKNTVNLSGKSTIKVAYANGTIAECDVSSVSQSAYIVVGFQLTGDSRKIMTIVVSPTKDIYALSTARYAYKEVTVTFPTNVTRVWLE